MEGRTRREGSQLLPHQPFTLAQPEVPRDVPGLGSRVSPVCGHLCIRVMSWDVGIGEVCGRASGVLKGLYGCIVIFRKPSRTWGPYRAGALGREI